MLKPLFLFLLSVLLLFIGSSAQKHPSWLESLRRLLLFPATSPSAPGLNTYTLPGTRLSFQYPSSWRQDPAIPSCGPVWLAPETNTTWFSICGPYTDPQQQSSLAEPFNTNSSTKNFALANMTAQRLNLITSTGKQTDIILPPVPGDSSSGTVIIHFYQALPSNQTETAQFETILASFTLEN